MDTVEPGFGPLIGILEETCPRDPEKGGWHLSLEQHIIESVLFAIGAGYLFHRSFTSFRHRLRHMAHMVVPPSVQTMRQKIIDAILFLALAASLALVVYHKYQGHKMAFLLQPCHMLHGLLLILFFTPRGSGPGAILFSVYLHLVFAPFLGFAAADRSCYKQYLELENWAFQHFMLMFVPMVWIVTGRFPLYTGWHVFTFSFTSLLLFHWTILGPVGLVTAVNLNYMLCPPVTVPAAVWLGKWYRPPCGAFCAILAWVLRYVLIEAFVRWMGKDADRVGSQAADASFTSTTYTDIEVDEGVIVTNTHQEADLIREASLKPVTAPVKVADLTHPRPLDSIDRLPSVEDLLSSSSSDDDHHERDASFDYPSPQGTHSIESGTRSRLRRSTNSAVTSSSISSIPAASSRATNKNSQR